MPNKLVRSTCSKSISRPKIVFLEIKFSVPWHLLLFTAVLLTLWQRLKSLAEITCLGTQKLINNTETAKHAQSLRMEHEGLSSPKEPGRKSASSSEEVGTIVRTIYGIDVKINIPEIFWNVFWQMMSSRLKFYIKMLYEKYSVSTLSRFKTIKLSLWCQESVLNSVIARVHNSGSHFRQTPTAFAGDLDFVRNSERPQ